MNNPLEQNLKAYALKKFMAQLLENKYAPYDDIISRMGHYMITEKDMASFTQMIADVYEVGFMKAVAEYKEQLVKIGVKVNVTKKNLVDNQK